MSLPAPYAALSPAPSSFLVQFLSAGVLEVSLRRKKLNPWDRSMTLELARIFRTLRLDPAVDVVILSGQGPAFCAGLDVTANELGAFVEADAARSAFALKEHIDEFQEALSGMEKCMKPVIAAVHGIVFGLGVDLMCCADVRIADEGARFCIKEVDIGLAADIGSLQRFPKITSNDSMARELALSAREFSPREALGIGFLSRITSGGRAGAVAAAHDLARTIAEKSPVAVRSTKRILLHARDHSVPEGLDYVATWNAAMLQSGDIPSAMKGALTKKKVTFERL